MLEDLDNLQSIDFEDQTWMEMTWSHRNQTVDAVEWTVDAVELPPAPKDGPVE